MASITVETVVAADIDTTWAAWTTPADIEAWNAASADWHTTRASVDLREGGRFSARMEARDGSAGFDFEGTYTRVVPGRLLEYRLQDDRRVSVRFEEVEGGVKVTETFDAEDQTPAELQRRGWQSILDSFARHVEAKAGR